MDRSIGYISGGQKGNMIQIGEFVAGHSKQSHIQSQFHRVYSSCGAGSIMALCF